MTTLLFCFSALIMFVIMWHTWQQTETDWLESTFVSTVSLIVLIGWISTILASFGIFSLGALAVIVLLLACGLFYWLHPIQKPTFFLPINWQEYALIILMLGCSFIYFRPHEYILGGIDPGVYVNIGATIAQTGQLTTESDWVQLLSDYHSVTLREQLPVNKTRYLQLMGWYIDDAIPSRIIPQFFPFHPTLIAIGISLAGLYGGLLVTSLWSILDIAAVYFLTRHMFDKNTALLASFLLAITPTHIFFSRYPTAEPLTLLLVFSSLLAFQHLWDKSSTIPIWGIFGGATLGAAFLTRIDLPVVLILVALALGIRWWQGEWSRGWTWYVITLVLFLIHASLSIWFINYPYFWNTYNIVWWTVSRLFGSNIFLSVGIIILLGMVIAFLLRGKYQLIQNRLTYIFSSSYLRWLIIIFIILLSAYAYFLRPIFNPPYSYQNWPAGSEVMVLHGLNWVRIGWYITPLGLLLTTLGLGRIIYKESLYQLGFFLSVGILTTIQYVYHSFIPSSHIYMMRRYVPIILPMLMIYIAVAIMTVFPNAKYIVSTLKMKIGLRQIFGVLLILFLSGGLMYQSHVFMFHQDYHGAVEQMTNLNSRLKQHAIILINEPPEHGFADLVGTTLHFTFGHPIATVRQTNLETIEFLHAMMVYAKEHNLPIQYITIRPISKVVQEYLQLEPVVVSSLAFPILENTYDKYPSEIITHTYHIEVYDVINPLIGQTVSDMIKVDVGYFDSAFIETGFYDREFTPNDPTMRWTSNRAVLNVPIRNDVPLLVDIRAKIYRPWMVPQEDVHIWLDNQYLGAFIPTDTWQTFSFEAASTSSKNMSSLRFETKTFNPHDLELSTDSRDLGFLIDYVKLRRLLK